MFQQTEKPMDMFQDNNAWDDMRIVRKHLSYHRAEGSDVEQATRALESGRGLTISWPVMVVSQTTEQRNI